MDDTEEDETGILAGRSKGRNRVRNLLSAYYGLGRQAGPGIDELAMDSPHFNAERYTAKVLKEKSLDEILRHDSSLVAESKTLASDLQMLVYENYSKFLSSLDTLRLMKQNMQTMEEQMHLLLERMDGITKSATAINEALAPKRDQVANLAGVDLTLKKIHFLLELPQSLRKCVERQAYGAAVRCYTVGSNILGKYSHIRSFQHIQEESHQVMLGLKDKLKEVLDLPLSQPENVAQVRGCLHLLAELDPSGIADHHDHVLQPIEAKLDAACDGFLAAAESVKLSTCSQAAVDALPPSQTFPHSIDLEALLQPFVKHCATFNLEMDVAAGLLGARRDAVDRKSAHLQTAVKKVFASLINLLLSNAQCRIHLCLSRHSARRSEQLAASAPSGEVAPAPLSLVCKQLAEMLRQEWRGFTHTMLATLGPVVPEEDLALLRPLLLVEGPSSFFLGLCTFLDNLGGAVDATDDAQRRMDVDTLLCVTLVAELLLKSGLPEFQAHPTTSLEPTLRQLESSHRQLMAQYCRLQGQRLGTLVRRTFDGADWVTAAPPSSVSPLQLQIVTEMVRISQHGVDVIPDAVPAPAVPRPSNRRTASESSSESGTPWATGGAKDIASEMEKIFNTKCYSFLSLNTKPKRLERGPLLECILNYAIKCQLECVRGQRFGKEGLQQLQIDTQFMKQAYAVYIRKPKALAEAADDIFASAKERCMEWQALPGAVVDGIVAQHVVT